jgi:2-polyprenyl-3-methyl-5-hydroxy-6-metoxy-1,4-benzoquinol methylase
MIRIQDIASNLEESEPGLWLSQSAGLVSYPEDGNRECREVEDLSFWFRHRNRCIIELVRRFDPGGTIFDIGGGNGVVAHALTHAGFEVVVVEPRIEGARGALERGLRPVICATAADAGFRPSSAAAIGLFDVVEHVENDVEFLRDVRALLRPQGRLYITVPAYQLLWSREDDYAGHHRRYSVGTLRQTLRSAGFAVEYSTYIFSVLPFAIVPFRTIPALLGLRRHASLSREHQPGGTKVTSLIERMLAFEGKAIRRGVSLPIGSSCVVVARALDWTLAQGS